MSVEIHVDVETRSPLDLTKVGVYRYCEDPGTDLWVLCYAVDDGPVKTWWPDQPCPKEFFTPGAKFLAWNASFERIIWRDILVPRYGFPPLKISQWDDVMVWALSSALPAALAMSAKAMQLEMEKDMDGRALMLKMAKPRKPRKAEREQIARLPPAKRPEHLWFDNAEAKLRLADYCVRDVEVERKLAHLIPRPPRFEYENWLLDQDINDRGVRVDLPLVRACKQIAEQAIDELNTELTELTGGAVSAYTQVQALRDWLVVEHQTPTESLDKAAIEALLQGDLPDSARRVLQIRQEGAKSSVGKLDAMLRSVCADGRIRGMFRFHLATTGRWSSTLVQLHNLPRGAGKGTDALCETLMHGDAAVARLIEGKPPLACISDALRGCLIPREGHVFIVIDFSQIEARINAYLAGQADIVQAFHDVDAGTGEDVYVVEARKIGSENRTLGKVVTLALGYQMGADKFRDTAAGYGIHFEYQVEPTIDLETGEIGERVVIDEADDIKTAWRKANADIVQFWWDLEAAAIAAVQDPGSVHTVGRIAYRTRGKHLYCRLPSGRTLCYPFPSLKWQTVEKKDGTTFDKLGLRYWTTDQGRWKRKATYGGHLCENVVQGTAADVLRIAFRRMYGAGLPPSMHVHDEGIPEVPIAEAPAMLEKIESMFSDPIPWLPGCPISAGGFICKRYQKD